MSRPDPFFDGDTFDPELDTERLASVLAKVHAAMLDGDWHTLAELAAMSGGSEASVSARLRDLRKDRFGAHDIERERVRDGLYRYRMRSARPLAPSDAAPQLKWTWGSDRYHMVSDPPGFTVARCGLLVNGEPATVWEAWDARDKPHVAGARLLGVFPFQVQAKARCEAEYRA